MTSREKARIEALQKFRLLNTPPEQELDEITQLASLICDTPVSLISLVDKDEQWFKSKVGTDLVSTPIEQSFCRHAIDSGEEVYIVHNPLNHMNFRENKLVTSDPHIRFYAGVPLRTEDGHGIGALCVIDKMERILSKKQIEGLKILAKKAMRFIEYKRTIKHQYEKLKRINAQILQLTDTFPGIIFQLEMAPEGKMWFPFISKGITVIHPDLDIEDLHKDAMKAFEVVHLDDVPMLQAGIIKSFQELTMMDMEYRITASHYQDRETWHWVYAKPERLENGNVVWYGTFQDISEKKAYVATLEKIIFDISHVLRKPVANLMGLTTMVDKDSIQDETVKAICQHVTATANELDSYIRVLNETYSEKRDSYAPLDLGRLQDEVKYQDSHEIK
ncbi:hypothetical protein KIH41_09565 [Litoribacter ruber]|uniref:GAF domain-containing protein n=1 Tax=Litoribacter ruber TaxID=702568 RepID=UPI001BDB2E58|nr:GAF domain-containing protein [Litoribacter ruber]MBT0811524.1 hypothetical protein [Litoribacter ruber]